MQRGPQLGLRLVNGSGTRRASGSRGRGKRSTAWNGGMDSEERTEEVQDDEAVGDETPGEVRTPAWAFAWCPGIFSTNTFAVSLYPHLLMPTNMSPNQMKTPNQNLLLR